MEDNDPTKLEARLRNKNFDALSKSKALCIAARTMNFECVRILLDAKANMFTKIEGRSALFHAVKNSHRIIVDMMLEAVEDGERSNRGLRECLFEASANGAVESVEILLQKGVDMNCSHYHDSEFVSMCTPLVAACYGPYILASCSGKFTKVAKLLISYGANVDTSDTFSETALHWASFNQLDEVVESMIEHELNLDVVNGIGKTPLMSCVEGLSHHAKRSSRALELLIFKGANVNLLDFDNFSALHYAVLASDEVVELLLKSGAEPNLTIDYVGLGTVTTLGMAILERSWKSVRHLVVWNADVNLPCFTFRKWIPFAAVCDAEQFGPEHAVLLALAGSDLWEMRRQLTVVHKDQLENVSDPQEKEQWTWLLQYASNPRSLKELCRLCVRSVVASTHNIGRLSDLPLPKPVMAYLQFSDL